jgi:hypothetical protein
MNRGGGHRAAEVIRRKRAELFFLADRGECDGTVADASVACKDLPNLPEDPFAHDLCVALLVGGKLDKT